MAFAVRFLVLAVVQAFIKGFNGIDMLIGIVFAAAANQRSKTLFQRSRFRAPTYSRYIAECRMMVAVRKGFDYAAASQPGSRLRIATKYPNITAEHFAGKGVHVDIIKLYGSMELAPLVGLSDAIVDLVSTGNTLKANGLEAVEHVVDISSRLVVNKAALKTKHALLEPIIQAFGSAAKAG